MNPSDPATPSDVPRTDAQHPDAPLDPVAAARRLRLAAAPSPWLHEEIGRRMQERLEWIRLAPARWADWEPVNGGLQAHRLVRARYPRAACDLVLAHEAAARVAQRELLPAWWSPQRWRGAEARLGAPAPGSVQMVWANMLLHHSAQPQALMAQWHQALATDGFVMFSALGPDTLRELRELYAQAGWPPPAQAFTDMHDWGDMLVAQGFAEPVMDMERITLSWDSARAALDELRGLGRNLSPQRHASLRGRAWLAALTERLDAVRPVTLSFEVVYGHALKPAPRAPLREHTRIGLDDMRDMLRRRPPGA